MSSTKQAAPESRIGYGSNNANNMLYLPTGYGETGNRQLLYGAAAAGSDKSTESTTGLGTDDTDLTQGIGYLDYFQGDNVGLTGFGMRRKLALQRAQLRRRNGQAALGASPAAGSASNAGATDLTGAGGALGLAGLTGLNSKGDGLIGLGSSGYGGYEPTSVVSGYGYGPSQQCKTGLNPLLVLLTLAAAAAGFYFLYTKVTKIAGRKKRDLIDMDQVSEFVFAGLEEFENKVDQIAAGHEENSWIGDLYKKFSDNFISGGGDGIHDDQMDGMEPPMLDETWGLEDIQRLHQENSTEALIDSKPLFEETMSINSNSTVINNNNNGTIINNKSNSKMKGEPIKHQDEDEDLKQLSGESKCNTKFWRCIANVVQGGAHYLQEPGGISNAVQKALFRVAFHGGFGNVWGALMSIPEARQVKKCLNEKDDCLSYEILKREAEASLDDSPRMIINPDFVEGLDQSDGAVQFDAEEQKKFDQEMGIESDDVTTNDDDISTNLVE